MIHPMALVADSEIGEGTEVWQFASVIRGARIGKNCIIGAGAQIDGASIGDGCHVQAGASIPHGVHIADRVFVGPGAVFCNDMWPDTTHDGIDHDALSAGCTIRVEEGASIGAGAVILPGVTVHAGAFVAAGAVVDRNVPPAMVWRRNGYIGPLPKDRKNRRMRLC